MPEGFDDQRRLSARRKRTNHVVSLGSNPTSETSTRSAWLVEHLRQALLDGKYPQGSRLNEVHLSRQLHVSRTPVRAALHVLAGEGLLRHRANKGFAVREFSLSEIVDAYELRALAEGLAARFAAERGLSDGSCEVLRQALAQGDRALKVRSKRETQRSTYARVNEIFHSTIHEAARSNLLRDVIRVCQRIPQASAHNVIAFDLEDVQARHQAHHRIYDAIVGREPREAEELMREHVLSVKISMIRTLAQKKRRNKGSRGRE